jgi:hypothetical protein
LDNYVLKNEHFLTADKKEIKDFPKLPSASSFIPKRCNVVKKFWRVDKKRVWYNIYEDKK